MAAGIPRHAETTTRKIIPANVGRETGERIEAYPGEQAPADELRVAQILAPEPLPGEGHWDTALLMDGNIGIGGDPRALLDRLARLLRPGGLLLAETASVDVDERVHVQVVHMTGPHHLAGAPFPWARLGTAALVRHAERAGWQAVGQWTTGGRSFAALRNRAAAFAAGRSRTRKTTAEPPKSAAVISSQRARKPSADSPAASR